MMAPVRNSGTVSEACAVANEVKQGCVLDLTLFSLLSSAMLMNAYRDGRTGTHIPYATDGHLNSRRMRLSTPTAYVALFADDCAPNTATEADMYRDGVGRPKPLRPSSLVPNRKRRSGTPVERMLYSVEKN
ncbi:hypothetical protein SprV_0301103600 [Sparganum proliferum]